MTRPLLALTGLLLLLASPPARAEAPALVSGKKVEGSFRGPSDLYRTYRVEVHEGARSLEVDLDATGAADLFVKAGTPFEGNWASEATAQARGTSGKTTLRLTRDGKPSLRTGPYFVDVLRPRAGARVF